MYVVCVCFFKQKTAYDMRISDWSSDLCASELLYEQTYGSWLRFSDRVMNRETRLLGWHYEWTAGQLTSLGSLFILLLAPLLSWLWPRLARRGLNPSKPLKSAQIGRAHV